MSINTNNTENLYLKFQEILQEFCETENPQEIIINSLEQICELFEFNKISIVLENFSNSNNNYQYEKVFDYNSKSKIRSSSENVIEKLNSFINLTGTTNSNLLNPSKLKNIGLFGDIPYTYLSNLSTIEKFMQEISFNDFKSTTSIFLQLIDTVNFVGVLIFEKNENILDDKEINVLKTITTIISEKIQSLSYKKYMEEKYIIENKLIENEEMPIAVLDKETYKVLFHNELYKTILPEIELGKVCYELNSKLDISDNQGVDTNEIIQHISQNNRFWIKKNIEVTLPNGKEVYLLYAKDTLDYMKQLDCVDNLTKCFSLQGFKNFYEDNVLKNKYNYALCTMDIDKFKYINDNLGFEIGNEILIRIAEVLKTIIVNSETFCRINEDRFCILLRYDNMDNLNQRFSNISTALDAMKQKYFPTKKITIIGGVSIVDRTIELNALIDKANIARKNAKGHHENKFSFYDERLEMETTREKFIEERMLRGVNNDEFVPYIQGKFNLKTREICGAEALVRWKSEDGIIYPDEFIPIFEKNGFINILDFIMYGKIMRFMRSCLDKGLKLYTISLNVSRCHIEDKQFLEKIMKLVTIHNIPTELIELEVTESMFIGGKEELKEFVDAIRAKNIRVSIDDFGTAYSSLHILKDIDVDVLKIDKEFLHNIVSEISETGKNITKHKDEIVLKHIIGMAKELGFEVICEGVETEDQIELLQRVGCELGQGYISSKPMPLDEFEREILAKLD